MRKLLARLITMVIPPVKMYDASTPDVSLPADAKIVAGYIGGDTPHVWTYSQWRFFGRLKKLPIYVVSNPSGRNATQDAFDCLMRLFVLGVPKGSPVVLDLETAIDAPYVHGFYQVIKWAGYKLWVYGSLDFVVRNPPCDGYWVADYTGVPHMAITGFTKATQYATGLKWDFSLVKYWQYRWVLRTW